MQTLYEDQAYIGFFKPSGVPTTYGSQPECFIKEVKESHPELFTFAGFKEEEGGLLYRLDNETSGLVLFAKNKEAHDKFIQDKNLKKIYLAEISDTPPETDVIDFPIVHKSSKRMAVLTPNKKVDYKGKPINAKTHIKKINEHLIECEIQQGARHQIRVHLASIGCPIIGDELYGGKHSEKMQLCCIGIQSDWIKIHLNNLL
jgi:23S rRNA pseudouridine1911/1915/1917 synthase